jgi:plasmid maintenance system antidote protein VapI/Zn-dependent peptidase ImmA (M78 family)
MTIVNEYFPQTIFPPGETLKEKLEEMNMGPKEFALRTGKPEKTIIAVLQGTSAITADMSVLFEQVTLIPAHYWLNHQRHYDEFVAKGKRKKIIQQSVQWAKQFPLAEMIKKQWLPQVSTVQDKTAALLNFFGFSSHTAWKKYYFKQQLKVAFSISLEKTNEPYAISVWLRKGDLQAAQLNAGAYSNKKLKEALPSLKQLMASQSLNFFQQLQTICLSAGVKVVHTPAIKKAPIAGATRWINDTPIIQLSSHYKRNDHFWHTFFHEIGHVLLHGKKAIFLEEVAYANKDQNKEKEADTFAHKYILTAEDEEAIKAATLKDKKDIAHLANQLNTSPAILVAKLHQQKRINASWVKEWIHPVVFE